MLAWKAGREDIASCIIIAYHTGLRIHEVVKIDTAAARRALKTGSITTKGKGGRVRDVELDEVATDELRKWLKQTRPGYKLFVPKEKQSHQVIKEIQDFIRENPFPQGLPASRPRTSVDRIPSGGTGSLFRHPPPWGANHTGSVPSASP